MVVYPNQTGDRDEPPAPRPNRTFTPEAWRVLFLVEEKKLDVAAYRWLCWGDEHLDQLPLDLRQAWAEGPQAWAEASESEEIPTILPHHYPFAHARPEYRAVVDAYMKSHLSEEDLRWFRAGERVRTLKPEAQTAWVQGAAAWAALLARPQPAA